MGTGRIQEEGAMAVVGAVARTGRRLGGHGEVLSRDDISRLTSFLFMVCFNLADSGCNGEHMGRTQGQAGAGPSSGGRRKGLHLIRPNLRLPSLPGGAHRVEGLPPRGMCPQQEGSGHLKGPGASSGLRQEVPVPSEQQRTAAGGPGGPTTLLLPGFGGPCRASPGAAVMAG